MGGLMDDDALRDSWKWSVQTLLAHTPAWHLAAYTGVYRFDYVGRDTHFKTRMG